METKDLAITTNNLYGRKHKIKMKVDTGVNGNIIPLRIYKKCAPITLTEILTDL